MKIEINAWGIFEMKEVFTAVVLVSTSGERLAICMKDGGFQFEYGGKMYEAKEGLLFSAELHARENALYEIVKNAVFARGTSYEIDEKYINQAKELFLKMHNAGRDKEDEAIQLFQEVSKTFENQTNPERKATGKSEAIDTPFYCSTYFGGKAPVKCSIQCETCKKTEGDEPQLCECGHYDCQHWPGICLIEGCNCEEFKPGEGPGEFNLIQHENLK